jgi:hypothetical protein
MFRLILPAAFLLLASVTTFAADLTPGNMVGKYKVSARAGFVKVYMNFNVIDTNEFEVQRTYSNGTADEVCNGKYNLHASVFSKNEVETLASGKIFKGTFTCPKNRQKVISFNIDFKDKTTEDLARGTSVTVTSSLAPGRSINAYVIKK